MTKTLKTILLILLAVAIATGCIVGIIYLSKSTNPPDPGNVGGDNIGNSSSYGVVAISDEGEKLYAGGTYAIPKAMTMVAEAPTESNYAPSGEFTITATVNGNEYINGAFDFICYFENGSDSWAKGKDANDYISITPATTNTAKVKLLAAFGAPIEIKAQLVGTDSSATCRVDYLQRITDYTVSQTGNDFGDTVGLDVQVTYGIGTVKGTLLGDSGIFYIKDEFESALKSLLKFDVTLKSYIITGSNTVANSGTYTYEPTVPLKYSDFIVGFDSLDTRHKEAIYYAWNAAVISNDYGAGKKNNLLVDFKFTYSYGGVEVNNIQETDYVIIKNGGCITGNAEGDGLLPDVELNGGVTF